MRDKPVACDEDLTPLDESLSDLGDAVKSLSDTELRDLLVALLSEWRDRCGMEQGFTN
ncbi:MAG TPA: hypothetical protein PKA57_12545 [Parvibaculum sp.]|uniref:hypothetical protein n=1 Tax=Parvibaculum sp. TaxID=2024848 RepID=UPI002CF1E012|nr:hypothetical protein [Parvibaculum sp.]HMM15449.1 hypothetical protein [Parvibaculum sp.]